MIKYLNQSLTVAAGNSGDTKLISGLAGTKRTVKLIGIAQNTVNILLTARNNGTTIAEIPSSLNMGYGYWYPLELDLTEQDNLYLGFKNNEGGSVTTNVAIAYEDTPAQGG